MTLPARPLPREGQEGAGKVCKLGLKPSADKPGRTSGRGTKGPPPHPRFNSPPAQGSAGGWGSSRPLGGNESHIQGAKREVKRSSIAVCRVAGLSGILAPQPLSRAEFGCPQGARASKYTGSYRGAQPQGSAHKPQVGAETELWAASSPPLGTYPELVGAQRAGGSQGARMGQGGVVPSKPRKQPRKLSGLGPR